MKKWCVIDLKGSDEFLTVCENKDEALVEGERQWDSLSDSDKKKRKSFMVGLCNIDDEGNYIELEDGNIDANVYEIAKEWC